MKTVAKFFAVMLVILFGAQSVIAQNVLASNENPTASTNQERAITVKNNSEKGVAIFAGPKENIREPRVQTFGGLSTNKVYVSPNDVVCLMTDDKKPIACTIVKAETTVVEINTSATGVTGK
ncbi:MAG: hypothetical protein KIS94_11970 [Chitinophagales bacterium]|nr:hypothetical protein [Chitinophagales bacterium]